MNYGSKHPQTILLPKLLVVRMNDNEPNILPLFVCFDTTLFFLFQEFFPKRIAIDSFILYENLDALEI